MEHWLIVLLVILGVTAVIFILAFSSGGIVIWAANRFYRKQEKELEKAIIAELPKTNCGECGCVSWEVYAKKWAVERKDPCTCPHLKDEQREKAETLINEQDAFVQERIATRPKNDRIGKRRV